MLSDGNQVTAASVPDWEFRFSTGEREQASLTGDQRIRLTHLQSFLPATGHALLAPRREELTVWLRALVEEGVSVDLLAVELRLPRAFVASINEA
ncbi:hypothetical protein C5E07_06915 [Pseudoclavibacter sp. RFBJ3]|uniref:hypothetical protein n=1 Tax=unclassified Pseudoclavibacter TaxID=2615177 RepID=UPI000CE7A13E|nr:MULTISPECIES: hypothetical protein [unclassified Pseudoclavibacter]PPF85386.1 hypothetical protein C5C12_03860 [Pseudoclavibacter sp. RFBJ5]PPF93220.1 hypothetical protein C5E07_06915 [Pseudoclavibacter sp. RFBJ3]PPF98866.1 hypothetical protein C5C19_06195 [Pseudoclavibacter sp. RFBH5]PPG25002.1 hypothetical protein C5E13_05645 [Pseudoclavibacter sp. RFBI4]